MLIRMTEVFEIPSTNKFSMREVSINPEHIVAIRQDVSAKSALSEGRMPEGLSKNIDFSRIYLNTGNLNIVVVGNSEMIEEKIRSNRRVLKG